MALTESLAGAARIDELDVLLSETSGVTVFGCRGDDPTAWEGLDLYRRDARAARVRLFCADLESSDVTVVAFGGRHAAEVARATFSGTPAAIIVAAAVAMLAEVTR